MAEEEQSQGEEKSHEPTQGKLNKSREQGDVPYSTEVTAATTYCAFFLVMLIGAAWSATQIMSVLAPFLRQPADLATALLATNNEETAAEITARLALALSPVFLALFIAIGVSVTGQRAFTFAPSKIKPKLSRLSIIDNAKQKYGANGLSEFLKNIAKLSAILGILMFAFKDRFLDLPAMAGLPASQILTALQRETIVFVGLVTLAAAAIATVDLPWRIFQHRNRLKMTFQELKKENKETEGDPTLKNARRQRAESIANNRMMQDVPTADIVIVNPTHYAVALKWDRAAGATPVCVAKGVDEVAARIREVASIAGVPIKRDPPTARSIHALVEIGDEIKREHYAAVAAAIHYADKMRKKWRIREL